MSLFCQLVHSELSLLDSAGTRGTASCSPLFNLRPNTQGTTAAYLWPQELYVLLIVWPRLQSEFKYISEWLISH